MNTHLSFNDSCQYLFLTGKIEFDDLFFDKNPYSPLASYKQSKLANILFSRELARRMKGNPS